LLQYILYKIQNTPTGWFVHLCYSNSLGMTPGCQNMEFLYVLCTMYHKVHWLENTLICKLCWHDCGWNNQLDAQFFFFYLFIPILYMFQATKCSSSGESIVSIWPLVYVTLCRWPWGMQV